MGLSIGIVGLPNVGKSTLFNAITRAGAEAANYPFCTIEPNVGVVDVPDERLDRLAAMFQPRRVVPAPVTFVDIAGLVRGASRGEGLGNQFLAHIRDVDAVAHVIRCFQNEDVVHVDGRPDPLRDLETIDLELALADLETVERRLERVLRAAKTGDAKTRAEQAALEQVKAALAAGRPARQVPLAPEPAELVRPLRLLTAKPVMWVANLNEAEVAHPQAVPAFRQLAERAEAAGAELVAISAKVEAELVELSPAERGEFMAALGIERPGLEAVIRTGYRLLGLITFFTAGEPEVRAWTVRSGTRAPQAAGVIHSDFERGFIRAEITSFADLMSAGSPQQARERGLMRLEGKDYVIADGDVVHFRFAV